MLQSGFFDLLPVELLHILFTYFSAHEILLTFSGVSDYINSIVRSYSAYRWNLKSIKRSDFDLICRHIQPEQVISLTLSDADNTPGQSELFFSCVQLESFTQLQSLRLLEIEFESLEAIFTNLYKLVHLRALSFDIGTIKYKYPQWTYNYSNKLSQLNSILSDVYSQIIPDLNHLSLNSGTVLKSILLPNLRHLKLTNCSLDELETIFQNAPQLKSLHICLKLNGLQFQPIFPSVKLTQLILIIEGEYSNITSEINFHYLNYSHCFFSRFTNLNESNGTILIKITSFKTFRT